MNKFLIWLVVLASATMDFVVAVVAYTRPTTKFIAVDCGPGCFGDMPSTPVPPASQRPTTP